MPANFGYPLPWLGPDKTVVGAEVTLSNNIYIVTNSYTKPIALTSTDYGRLLHSAAFDRPSGLIIVSGRRGCGRHSQADRSRNPAPSPLCTRIDARRRDRRRPPPG